MLTQTELKRLWDYNPSTGIFTRLVRNNGRVNVGDVADSLRLDGYIQIQISGKTYLCHRLAWLYMTGNFPNEQTDHLNGIRHDNRWVNLRDATNSINQQNQRGPKSNNKSGHLGVSWYTRNGKWRADIKVNGKSFHLGTFDDVHEAAECYLSKKRELHEGCTI